ncbi:MAG: hypothetical protein EPO27_10755 [Betaproteobacteria bacterium]|nr:MAG: hypothetical protein EPO27_10755 [Betaproteobacteria bacterium]
MEITEDKGVLSAAFLPPWRMAIPLPDVSDASKPFPLVITGEPRPQDKVFELPFGDAAGGIHVPTMMREQSGRTIFTGPGSWQPEREIIPLPPGPVQPLRVDRFQPHGVTSSIGVPLGPIAVQLATIRDLPRTNELSIALACALVTFGLGLLICVRTLADRDVWAIAGLAAFAWNVVALRLLLAFRYALDPTGLDLVAVRGVITSTVTLVLTPAFLFLIVTLYRERFISIGVKERRGRLWSSLAYLVLVGGVAIFLSILVPETWPNLPERLKPATSWGTVLIVSLVFLTFAALFGYTYRLNTAQQERLQWLANLSTNFPRQLVFKHARGLWELVQRPGKSVILAAVWFLVYMVTCALFWALQTIAQRQVLIQELIGPIFLAGIPLLLWLGLTALLVGRGIARIRDVPVVLFVGLLVLIPIFSPVALLDVGGIFATLAYVLPLVFVLLYARPVRVGLYALGAAFIALVLLVALAIASVSILPDFGVKALERGISRLLVFRGGDNAQQLLPFTQLSRDVGQGVPLQSLQNSIEHTWENAAIAHLGGWLGMGFGNAPTRRSMVPQHVLQYDSTFSFFIVSEHGLVGGLALLTMYALPFILISVSARRRFDIGHCIALVIAAGLLNEALIQAAMNVGALPFTGRNLPLLSVNSTTDAIRCTLLLCLAAQAICWRQTGERTGFSPPYGFSILHHGRAGDAEPENRSSWACAIMLGALTCVTFAILCVLIPAYGILKNNTLKEPFGWDRLILHIEDLIQRGLIEWDSKTKTVSLRNLRLTLSGETFLEQEVTRFNSLPLAERLDITPDLQAFLSRVRTIAEYDSAFAAMAASQTPPEARRPLLFRVTGGHARDSEATAQQVERLEVNPAFNIRLQLTPDQHHQEIPSVLVRGTARDRVKSATDLQFIGPAWVNGRWRTAVDLTIDIPWSRQLAAGLRDEWHRLGGAEATRHYGKLSFDVDLQNAAMDFTMRKGRLRHEQLLAMRRTDVRQALPPRIALSILEVPSGQVLALGGWPRMSPFRTWGQNPGGWLPSASWLESTAPTAIVLRYGGDRNFDLIEMGSATKPLFAAAVLRRTPQLDKYLRTRGTSGEKQENSVFGIPIRGRAWPVPADGRWRDVTGYMAVSDNRYETRLAFLGLAQFSNGNPVEDPKAGVSPSHGESIRTPPSPWRRYPAFPPELGFSAAQPNAITNLHQTELASNFFSMFRVRRNDEDPGRIKRSFWTLQDDADPTNHLSDRLLYLSPPSPNFRLDLIHNPREYVSLALGGAENRWANVDFAAAFASVVIGKPIAAHLPSGSVRHSESRASFEDAARRLRPGLAAVAQSGGTAYKSLQATKALDALRNLGVRIYAKTGTLSTDDGRTETSRLVVALIRWKNEIRGEIESGVVISLVAEHAHTGFASLRVGEFITENRETLQRILRTSK